MRNKTLPAGGIIPMRKPLQGIFCTDESIFCMTGVSHSYLIIQRVIPVLYTQTRQEKRQVLSAQCEKTLRAECFAVNASGALYDTSIGVILA